MVSGGDDSSLHAAVFDLVFNDNDTTKVHVIHDVTEPSAHTSSVTGNDAIQPTICSLGLPHPENEFNLALQTFRSHNITFQGLSELLSQPDQFTLVVDSGSLAWRFGDVQD